MQKDCIHFEAVPQVNNFDSCMYELISPLIISNFLTLSDGGIAVDWINDKIYWTENKKIMVFDLTTNSATEIATLTGTPLGIGVFPYRNNA